MTEQEPKRPVPAHWAAQFRHDFEFAKQCVLEDGSVGMMFAVHGRDKMLILPAPKDEVVSKESFYRIVSLHCLSLDAEALTYISEAWMRVILSAPDETDAEADARAYDGPMPSEADDRIEVVTASLAFRDEVTGERRTLMGVGRIVRDGRNRPVRIDLEPDFAEEVPADAAGMALNVFPPGRPTPDQRVSAARVLEQIMEGLGATQRTFKPPRPRRR